MVFIWYNMYDEQNKQVAPWLSFSTLELQCTNGYSVPMVSYITYLWNNLINLQGRAKGTWNLQHRADLSVQSESLH